MLNKIERMKRKESGATESKKIKQPQTGSNYQQVNDEKTTCFPRPNVLLHF
jgi:hypothetical protein